MSATTTIIGNATSDPALRFTPAGKPRATFGVAVNRRWLNKATNEWDEQVSFFNVVAWGDLGENLAESIRKGERVVVAGRLEQRSWEASDGSKRSTVELVADEAGPSLRWATAVVTKVNRSNGAAPAAPAARAGFSQQPSYDEEPF